MTRDEWEREIAEVWQSGDQMADDDLRHSIAELVAGYPGDDGAGVFELAGSWDSTGQSDKAVPLYEQALAQGLPGDRRRRAVIQMASSLRNIGDAKRAERILRDELAEASDELDDAVVAFLALALVELGRPREAVSITLGALAGHLPRYNRSLRYYATEIGRRDEE